MSSSQGSTLTSSSTSQQQDGQQPLGFRTSSNLYLVTFLATLFLLLFISCAIVFRSFVARRRYQRRLNEALAAGIVFAPRSQGGRRRRFGTKPKFFHSWLATGGNKWDQMMPLSALPVQAKRRSRHSKNLLTSKAETMALPTSDTPSTRPASRARCSRLHDFFSSSSNGAVTAVPTNVGRSPEKSSGTRVDLLQVSVLIVMPSPPKPLKFSSDSIISVEDDEGEAENIPEVVFGVTRLPYHHPNPQHLDTSCHL